MGKMLRQISTHRHCSNDSLHFEVEQRKFQDSRTQHSNKLHRRVHIHWIRLDIDIYERKSRLSKYDWAQRGKLCSEQRNPSKMGKGKNGNWQHFPIALGRSIIWFSIWWIETISIHSDNHDWNWLLEMFIDVAVVLFHFFFFERGSFVDERVLLASMWGARQRTGAWGDELFNTVDIDRRTERETLCIW